MPEWKCSKDTAEFSCKTGEVSGTGVLSATFPTGPWEMVTGLDNYLTCIFALSPDQCLPRRTSDESSSYQHVSFCNSSGWHSFANPVKRGGTAGSIYDHRILTSSAGHAKPGQSPTAVNLRQQLFSSTDHSAL